MIASQLADLGTTTSQSYFWGTNSLAARHQCGESGENLVAYLLFRSYYSVSWIQRLFVCLLCAVLVWNVVVVVVVVVILSIDIIYPYKKGDDYVRLGQNREEGTVLQTTAKSCS